MGQGRDCSYYSLVVSTGLKILVKKVSCPKIDNNPEIGLLIEFNRKFFQKLFTFNIIIITNSFFS